MKKSLDKALIILPIIAICLSIIAIILSVSRVDRHSTPPEENTKDVQYVLYLGTNDKDTNEPVFSPEEAKEKAEEILIDHFGGYTIQEASGGWENEGTRYTEYTLVIFLSDTTLEEVHAAADDMIRTFNQSSVLIQANETMTEFYSG